MRKIKLKNGGHINVLSENEKPIDGEINFTEKEFDWAKKISKDNSDPEAEKTFWKTVIDKKLDDKSYSLFTDFPQLEVDRRMLICQDIIEMLGGRKNKEA